MHLDLAVEDKVEVDKLVKDGFIRDVQFPIWLANVVPIKKKNSHIWVCIYFRDLSKAYPRDDFLIPYIELPIDATTD